MDRIGIRISLSEELHVFMKSLATSEGVTMEEMYRRALSVFKVYDEQMRLGRTHLGFSADGKTMDAELIGIIQNVRSV